MSDSKAQGMPSNTIEQLDKAIDAFMTNIEVSAGAMEVSGRTMEHHISATERYRRDFKKELSSFIRSEKLQLLERLKEQKQEFSHPQYTLGQPINAILLAAIEAQQKLIGEGME